MVTAPMGAGMEQKTGSTRAVAPSGSVVSANRVVVVSSDVFLRERLRKQLQSMRWTVEEACGGAEALVRLEEKVPAAVLLDGWLPDLEAGEFALQLRSQYPGMDLLHLDGTPSEGAPRSARRNELLHALREVQEEGPSNGPAWSSAPLTVPAHADRRIASKAAFIGEESHRAEIVFTQTRSAEPVYALPEMVGDADEMRELGRMIRLVAPRTATVLIEGETGTGRSWLQRRCIV